MSGLWPWLFAVLLTVLYYWYWLTSEIWHMHVVADCGFKGAVCATGVLACLRKHGTWCQHVYIGVFFVTAWLMRCVYNYCIATMDRANQSAASFVDDVYSMLTLVSVQAKAHNVPPMIASGPHTPNASSAALSFDLWGYTLEGCITAVSTYGVAQHRRLVDSLFVLFVLYFVCFVPGECFLLWMFYKRVWKL